MVGFLNQAPYSSLSTAILHCYHLPQKLSSNYQLHVGLGDVDGIEDGADYGPDERAADKVRKVGPVRRGSHRFGQPVEFGQF